MALLRDYHAAIGEIIIKYNGTLERYAGDGVMVVFNDPVPVETSWPANSMGCNRNSLPNCQLAICDAP